MRMSLRTHSLACCNITYANSSLYLLINSAGFCPFVNSPFMSQRIVGWPNAAAQAPGSRKMLPPSSPLRTGHESFPSSGSSPWPLSPVLLVTLTMAPGVYETFVLEVVCSTLTCRDNMIRFYGFSLYKWDGTQSASVSLFLVQYQPLFRVGFPAHVLLLALCPVLAQSWVIGGVLPCDLGEAGDWGCVGFDQCCLPSQNVQ